MAKVFPAFENIHRLKVKPTSGELYLLHTLTVNLNDDFEVYYQPMLNGDLPDIIVVKKGHGAAIIEVKDWSLQSYHIDENNTWHENRGGNKLRSPFQQVFGYKKNLFDLHINGLAEKHVLNRGFFGTIKAFVYFHNSDKHDIETIFSTPEASLRENTNALNFDFKNRKIDHNTYLKKMDYLETKIRQLNRDKGISIHEGNIGKLFKALKEPHPLFDDEIYEEFRRYLSPPYHVAAQGLELKYDNSQVKLIASKPGFQKIKGVAGSGKTTVLAQRAVNAHKRHEDRVLILTYNKTLRNHIHDKINAVRDDFSWGFFVISNYHAFITQEANRCGLEFEIPDDWRLAHDYMDKFYSNEKLFDGCEPLIYRYKTILIDEIQDYQPEWIKIIRKYFLEPEGEMVLFGDDSQNIYSRNLTKRDSALVRGFGEWVRLKKSYRAKDDSLITRLGRDFQEAYIAKKCDVDLAEVGQQQGALSLEVLQGIQLASTEEVDKSRKIFDSMVEFISREKIHPNDICVVSSSIELLRRLDKLIRDLRTDKTQTTFETEEQFQTITSRKGAKPDHIRRDLETIRSSKKFSFQMNSGLMKLATIHSFKGMEASTIIYIPSHSENEEMVYTSITRARKNLLIFFTKENPYLDFIRQRISTN
ncbi:UvrD-helicase domain-containing protein [Noviherbaspirillum sp. 1P10PC]|uniref:nuclease-related domain-containing DEAD/DEAH box helicase n=1 Tax=Noviherbaspirillum sp. 1P10PC TaxID=3132292 RepID=UPI0039A25512